jgi:SAM-dependent methyltransferase
MLRAVSADGDGARRGGDRVDSAAWNGRYATDELVWRAEPNRFLVEEVEGLTPGRALDVACGEGRNAVWLASRGWKVVGVDFSSVALAKARRMAEDRGADVEWVEADVVSWIPLRGVFDLVAVMYLHVPADQRRQVLANAAAALAPGGVLLVVGHDATNPAEGFGGPQDPAVLYGAQDVVCDLGGLRIERAERVERPVDTESGPAVALDALVRAVRPA